MAAEARPHHRAAHERIDERRIAPGRHRAKGIGGGLDITHEAGRHLAGLARPQSCGAVFLVACRQAFADLDMQAQQLAKITRRSGERRFQRSQSIAHPAEPRQQPSAILVLA